MEILRVGVGGYDMHPLEFPFQGVGGVSNKSVLRGGMDIFWNNTITKFFFHESSLQETLQRFYDSEAPAKIDC